MHATIKYEAPTIAPIGEFKDVTKAIGTYVWDVFGLSEKWWIG